MIAEPQVTDGKFHQDYMRVVEPGRTDWLIDEKFSLARRWERLAQLYHVFKDLSETKLLYNADSITPALKELSKLAEKF